MSPARHPLTVALTHATEAAGALRALLLAENDERLSAADRRRIKLLRAAIRRATFGEWLDPALAANAGRLRANLYAHDSYPDDMLSE